jgi:hypothetical protein
VIDLHPCTACRRHVSSDEMRCPFCGAGVVPSPPHIVPAGRRTRAAVFATLTAAAAAAGCGGKTKNDQSPPPPPPQVDAAVAEPVAVDAPTGPVDVEEQPYDRFQGRKCVNGVCPPYGGPPARRRVV